MKKIIATLLSIITMATILGTVLTPATFAGDTNSTKIAASLVIPTIKTLPGPGMDRQTEPGGVTEWFVEGILPNWTIGIVSMVGGLAFLMLIVSGVKYLTAYTNEEAATSAKKMIMYSLVGLFLALFSYTIVKIIVNIDFVNF